MNADEDDIRAVAHDVWHSLTGMKLERRRDHGSTTAGAALTAIVRIEGTWKGVVAVRCPFALARLAAGRMCARDANSIQDGLVNDSLGELANIVAAKLKRWLPGGTLLSTPQVLGWKSQGPIATDCDIVRHVASRCDGYPVDVYVYALRGFGRSQKPVDDDPPTSKLTPPGARRPGSR